MTQLEVSSYKSSREQTIYILHNSTLLILQPERPYPTDHRAASSDGVHHRPPDDRVRA